MKELELSGKQKICWERRAILKMFMGLAYWKVIEFILHDSKWKNQWKLEGDRFFSWYKRKTY